MGLDNGIEVRAKTPAGKRYLDSFPRRFGIEGEYIEGFKTYEIAYWRKCWNIRRAILDIVTYRNTKNDGDFCFYFGADVLADIADRLKDFLNEDYWRESEGSSIWTWTEAVVNIARGIQTIRFILEDIEYGEEVTAEDLEFRFYDSY